MVVGSIALHTSEAPQYVLAICHQPCWLLYRHTIDFRNHAKHTEVEISKICARKLAQRTLDERMFPRSRSEWVLEDESPTSEQLDAHDQEAELEEDHRCRQTLLSNMHRDVVPIVVQTLGEPGAREVRPVPLQRQIPAKLPSQTWCRGVL